MQPRGMGPQGDGMDEEAKQGMGMYGGLMGGGGSQVDGKHPREESYWDMWKSTFCPQFNMVSFTFLVWVINTAAYLFTLCMMISPEKELNYRVFLGPDPKTLHAWGALDSWEI